MIPYSYSIDSQTKSTELADKILAANAPPQIAAAITEVESHLQKHSPDQSRHFFSIAFPALICKLFGFDETSSMTTQRPASSTGWIDTVYTANDSDLAGRLFKLLSPNGLLMSSITAVDRLSLVKFVFPTERLPEWVRIMVSSERDCRVLEDLCVLFKGRIKEDRIKMNCYQLHLNVFEYYLFWFAYYPVCRGNGENCANVSLRKSRKFRLENWTSSIPVFSGGGGCNSSRRGRDQKPECNLYIRLLYAYLRAFVPVNDVTATHQPYRSSLLHYSVSYDDTVVLSAEFLVHTFVHFWLVDNDPSPLPVSLCKFYGVSFPFLSVMNGALPVPGLGEIVKLFVNYANLSSIMVTEELGQVEYSTSPGWQKSGSADAKKSRNAAFGSLDVGSWNSCIRRPLYRFILRTFLFSPMGTSLKNVSEVVSLWVSYMEPWKLGKEHFEELDAMADGSKKPQQKEEDQLASHMYSSSWEGYVLSNYLFYTNLVMHFIGFAHKFLHTDAEEIVQLVLKVTNVLTSSKELLNFVKNVDNTCRSKHSTPGKSAHNSFSSLVSQIRDQLQDWEDGLCEMSANGLSLHEDGSKDMRLFNGGEHGGEQLLELFILRAESELQTNSSDPNNLQSVNALKEQLCCLSGERAAKSQPTVLKSSSTSELSHDGIFKPRKVSNGLLNNVQYKGDWMTRPISDDEVAWLAKLLIRLSHWLNQSLGLNKPESSSADPATSYMEVPADAVTECGPSETLKVILCSIASFLLILRSALVRLMIRYGLKVNLRVFASKVLVLGFFLGIFIILLMRAFRSVP